MIPLFKVKKAGIYASIQDRGRFGHQRFGVPLSGPMDAKAFSLGQYIIGHKKDQPALELFYGGLVLEVLSDHRILITGADMLPELDGKPVMMWKTFDVHKGQTLTFSYAKKGSIAYLLPAGGFAGETMLGSASVYPKGEMGDVLKEGETLYAVANKTEQTQQRGLVFSERPKYENLITVEVFPSPHRDLFKQESIETFFRSAYTLKTGDRMGFLLDGPTLEHVNSSDILSEATQFGTIQVPQSGLPMILMADAQTIGGYATIGKIASGDLWKVAQLQIGGKIHFQQKIVEIP